jgi:hypothetical protein
VEASVAEFDLLVEVRFHGRGKCERCSSRLEMLSYNCHTGRSRSARERICFH